MATFPRTSFSSKINTFALLWIVLSISLLPLHSALLTLNATFSTMSKWLPLRHLPHLPHLRGKLALVQQVRQLRSSPQDDARTTYDNVSILMLRGATQKTTISARTAAIYPKQISPLTKPLIYSWIKHILFSIGTNCCHYLPLSWTGSSTRRWGRQGKKKDLISDHVWWLKAQASAFHLQGTGPNPGHRQGRGSAHSWMWFTTYWLLGGPCEKN